MWFTISSLCCSLVFRNVHMAQDWIFKSDAQTKFYKQKRCLPWAFFFFFAFCSASSHLFTSFLKMTTTSAFFHHTRNTWWHMTQMCHLYCLPLSHHGIRRYAMDIRNYKLWSFSVVIWYNPSIWSTAFKYPYVKWKRQAQDLAVYFRTNPDKLKPLVSGSCITLLQIAWHSKFCGYTIIPLQVLILQNAKKKFCLHHSSTTSEKSCLYHRDDLI